MEYTIEIFDKEHVAAAAALERECFSMPWSEDMIAEELEGDGSYYAAALSGETAEHGGRLVGYAGMRTVLDEGYITNVAVAAGARRRGIARALVGALEAWARERGLAFMTLEVRVSNDPAVALYRGLGFAEAGVRPGYYVRPDEDALIMTKMLDPVIHELRFGWE